MPHHHMVLPHYMGRSREIDIEKKNKEDNQNGTIRENFSSPSPLQDIPLLLPQEADGLDAPILDQKLSAMRLNQNLLNQPTNGLVSDPQTKGFMDDLHSRDLKSESNLNTVTQSGSTTPNEWSESSDNGDHAVAADDYGQIGPRTACEIQVSNASWIPKI